MAHPTRARSILPLAAASLLAVTWISPAWGGAWIQPEGTLFLRLASKSYHANSIFNSQGKSVPGDWWHAAAKFDELSFNLIAEYGAWGPVTLTAESTAKLMHSDDRADLGTETRMNGLSDVLLGVRYGFYQKALVAAVEGKVEIPTGYTRYDDRISLGAAQYNGLLRAAFGGGMPLPFPNYFDTGFGFRYRGGPYSPDLVASASVGAQTFKDLWFRIGSSGVFNLGPSTSAGGGQPADASYLSGGAALTYLFSNGLGVEVAASVDLWGKNTFDGWGAELVLQYRLPFYKT